MAKSRKETEFERRSKAAKKGWKTRKKRIKLTTKIRKGQSKVRSANKAVGKPKIPNPRIQTKRKSVKELEEQLKQSELRAVQAEQMIATVGFVDVRSPEWLHRDKLTLAAHPCRLRHLEEAPKLRRALRKARKAGEREIARMATDIAEHYDIPVREVYTLFWSP